MSISLYECRKFERPVLSSLGPEHSVVHLRCLINMYGIKEHMKTGNHEMIQQVH